MKIIFNSLSEFESFVDLAENSDMRCINHPCFSSDNIITCPSHEDGTGFLCGECFRHYGNYEILNDKEEEITYVRYF